MKKLIPFLFIPAGLSLHAQVLWQINKDTVITWHYREGDEFNGKAVNTNYWEFSYGWARSIYGNKEQEYYTEGRNHELAKGELTLTAKKEQVYARVVDWKGDNDSIYNGSIFAGLNKRIFNYTAGMIESRREMLYGYFEIKFELSPAKGYWPAFWLWGGNPNEEIDFFELKTEKKNKIHVGRHSQNRNENYLPYFLFKKKVWGDWITFKGDLTKTYNVIAGEWTKDYIKYYLNGECIAYTKVPLNMPKKLVANIAVPGNGPFKPGPSAEDTMPGEFKIDYIRVWTGDPAEKSKTIPIDSFAVKRELGRTSLVSKTKFLYGERSIHRNEGITVSLVASVGNKYKLTVLGKDIPSDAVYTLYNDGGKRLMSARLEYGESILDLDEFNSKEFRFEVVAFGKRADCYLSSGR